jgi:hypothetical protein
MKFGMYVLPLEASVKLYFSIPKIGNTIMTDARICEVGATLAPPNIGTWNYVW